MDFPYSTFDPLPGLADFERNGPKKSARRSAGAANRTREIHFISPVSRPRKILCLLSWKPATRWLWDYLPESDDQIDFASPAPAVDRYPGYGKFLSYYPKYWQLGRQVFPRQKDYDLIIAWEANTALPLALMRSLSAGAWRSAGGRYEKIRNLRPPLLVLNFVLKGRPALDLLPLIRVAMRSIDQITCLSQREIDEYARLLNFPLERCRKLQGPFRDHFENSSEGNKQEQGHIFSAGRSHRDYRTLVEAKKMLGELAPGWANVPLVINARRFNVKNLRSTADIQINPFLPFELYLASLSAARFAVAPLLPARHASGETFMIQAMTARKAVIASETFSTAEMIEPGRNGLLVPPQEPQALAQAMLVLLEHPEYARRLGEAAREHYLAEWSFPVAAKKIHQIIQELC